MAFMPSDGGMIKKTFIVFLSSILFFVAGCTTDSYIDKKSSESEVANVTEATQVTKSAEELLFNPSKEYGSLWESDLFADDRFTLKIKLSDSEKREAKKLARSFESHMDRAKIFMHYLLTELEARNLPAELAAVPLVESGFKVRARSYAGAHGPWQFMRRTGKSFGLKVTSHYDEFYDFVTSTQASLSYLEHLYKELNQDWELALIGYNQGEFGVKKAIRAAKRNGVKNLSAENLPLTRGARTYLKRFRAYAAILQEPEAFGVSHPEVDNRIAFKRVAIGDRVNSMAEAAKIAGVDLDDLKHLNAGFLTDSLKSESHRGLLIPSEHALQFEQALGLVSGSPVGKAYTKVAEHKPHTNG